ncbi:hypothetical protein ETAA8_63920 [Anatilimnocola aggregata]|uniref:Uncharacterized protein n=1 Tax=Anatilimnocola aggregata TaxID=2528021 RepID=A0A517YLZ8_9BACT|nr:hypothetical protein [Anatilimnocola aggregata]QDU31239.1 hypothetical protein ETAA8_63920 [Anatilimnocola aggregata]
MSQQLIIQLSDDAFAQLQLQAASQSMSPAEIATADMERLYSRSQHGDGNAPLRTTKQPARGLLRKHFGTFDLGCPVGTDNEQIDADLAREYGSTHEE